jgi:hypothetical protein
MKIFPNPVTASSKLTIQLPQPFGGALIRVLDPIGRIILTYQMEKGSYSAQLDLIGRNLSTGMYVIEAVGENSVLSQRFMILE